MTWVWTLFNNYIYIYIYEWYTTTSKNHTPYFFLSDINKNVIFRDSQLQHDPFFNYSYLCKGGYNFVQIFSTLAPLDVVRHPLQLSAQRAASCLTTIWPPVSPSPGTPIHTGFGPRFCPPVRTDLGNHFLCFCRWRYFLFSCRWDFSSRSTSMQQNHWLYAHYPMHCEQNAR